MGHEACEGCVKMGGGDVCGLRHLDLRRSSYGATKRVMVCVEMNGGTACGRRHLDLRWSSYGATNRVRIVSK